MFYIYTAVIIFFMISTIVQFHNHFTQQYTYYIRSNIHYNHTQNWLQNTYHDTSYLFRNLIHNYTDDYDLKFFQNYTDDDDNFNER